MGTHGIFRVPPPRNEPVREFTPGSPERSSLTARLDAMKNERIEIPLVIGGKDVTTGTTRPAVMPHDREHVLADVHQGGADETTQAIDAKNPSGSKRMMRACRLPRNQSSANAAPTKSALAAWG